MREVARIGDLGVARALRWLAGFAVGLLARVWLATLRLDVTEDPALEAVRERPWALAFFHGTQWPLLAWRRRRPTLVMVSLSLDGSLQARALATLGFSVVRGSTSRGGVRALAALTRRMKRGGMDAAFAVDGPRGPYGIAKGGAAVASRAAGAVLVPMGSAFANGKTFDRAWDRFGLAWPFSRVVVALGAPIEPSAIGALPAGLSTAIAEANETAGRRLSSRPSPRETLARIDQRAGVAEPNK